MQTYVLFILKKNEIQIYCFEHYENKTKVISANLLDLDFDFEDINMFGNTSVLVTFQFW